MTNIIADVAGQYKTLLKLVEKMPAGEYISLGDMVDRGPDSPRVLQWFKNNGRAVLGNHEHMMLDHLTHGRFYDRDVWLWNGGSKTLEAYPYEVVTQEHIDWLSQLPKFIEVDDCLLSHAFLRGYYSDEESIKYGCEFGKTIWDKDETTIIWNRGEPIRRPTWRLQICGHNSQFGLRHWADDQGRYATCLDDSRKRVLTGMVLETGEIFQQEYID